MRSTDALWLALAGCLVSPDTSALPCPCAEGFVCVGDRCVRAGASVRDAASAARDASVARDGGVASDADPPPDAATSGRDAEIRESGAPDVFRPPDAFRPDAPLAFELDEGTSGAELEGTRWGDGWLALDGVRVGRYRSPVFDAGTDVRWVGLRWLPRAPYGKPLPSGRGPEHYARGSADTTANELLVHFDDGPRSMFSEFEESAGRGVNVVAGAGEVGSGEGVFGLAAVSPTSDYGYARIELGGPLDTGSDDVTWSFWARSEEPCEDVTSNNQVYVGVDGSTGDGNTHLWLGCNHRCRGEEGGGHLGGTWRTTGLGEVRAGDICDGVSTTPINDGAWHHVAAVKEGHAPGTLTLYRDGRVVFRSATEFERPFFFADRDEFAFSGFSGNTFRSNADIDELAVFRRALSPEEIESHYLRGRLRAAVRVRVCGSADCSDGSFGAPLRDPADTPGPEVAHALDLRGRYAQLEVILESDAEDASPEIDWLRLEREAE